MQKVEGICKQCGGDGERKPGVYRHMLIIRPPVYCLRCKGSGVELDSRKPLLNES